MAPVPALLDSFLTHSIVGRARQRGIVQIEVHDLRKWGIGKHKQIDDYPYGGGAGMVLRVEPFWYAVQELKNHHHYDEVILLSAEGQPFTQEIANRLSLCSGLMLLCGHYKGVDERVSELCATVELSIGDYVLSGGELAAAVVVDAVVRLLPGVLGDETSALDDSFQEGLLGAPVYTRPREFRGLKVPEVLLSGNHQEIERWRYEQAIKRTSERRPDLYERYLKRGRERSVRLE